MWRTFGMNQNIVTRKFLTQKFMNEINVNYGIYIYMYISYGWKFSGVLNFMKSCNKPSELIFMVLIFVTATLNE